jgi:preprotein translocase subunit SecA
VRGSLPNAPAPRNITESLGGEPVTNGSDGNGLTVGGAAGGAGVPGAPKPGYTPTGARIGRNDPCWCGSGAKYKKCHGR